MEPRSFVTKKTTLTPERILAVLRDNIGEIQHLQPLAEGEESQAFGFVGEGQSYVVRIHRGDTGFRKFWRKRLGSAATGGKKRNLRFGCNRIFG